MNEAMKQAWLEITEMLGEPTREELDVFLRTWQRATEAHRKALAEQPAQQEPVAWRWVNSKNWLTYGEVPHDKFESIPLYTKDQL